MEALWFWIIVFLVILGIASAPGWGYTRDRWPYSQGGRYRYYPAVGAALAVVLILLFFWLGLIAIAWPWTAAPVAVD